MGSDEERRFQEDIRRIDESYAETDEEFKKWKGMVLRFEHSEYCSDDHSVSDDRIRDRECVWTEKDETAPERSDQQDDEWLEDNQQ